MDVVAREHATPEKLGLLMAGVYPEPQPTSNVIA